MSKFVPPAGVRACACPLRVCTRVPPFLAARCVRACHRHTRTCRGCIPAHDHANARAPRFLLAFSRPSPRPDSTIFRRSVALGAELFAAPPSDAAYGNRRTPDIRRRNDFFFLHRDVTRLPLSWNKRGECFVCNSVNFTRNFGSSFRAFIVQVVSGKVLSP